MELDILMGIYLGWRISQKEMGNSTEGEMEAGIIQEVDRHSNVQA